MKIEIDGVGLEELSRAVGPDIMRAAQVSALNRTMAKMRTVASREIRAVYNAKARDVREATRIVRASWSRPEAVLIAKGPRLPLAAFGARVTKRGVTIRVKKHGGRRAVLHHAFMPPLKGDRVGIYQRRFQRPSGGQRWKDVRLPIDELFGPSIPQMLSNVGVLDQVLADANVEYTRQLEHELKFRINRALGGKR